MTFGEVSLALKIQNLNNKRNCDENNKIAGTKKEETIKNC